MKSKPSTKVTARLSSSSSSSKMQIQSQSHQIQSKFSDSNSNSKLSGSYIRTLVKQLASGESPPENGGSGAGGREAVTPKKQVRRRLHTSRPYQERLLNMAEARKEIVAALKFHRASMNERRNQPPKPPPQGNFQSNSNNFYANSSFGNPSFQIDSNSQSKSSLKEINLALPNQTLGLNLNLQSFANFETIFYNNDKSTTPPPSLDSLSSSSSMSPSSSASPPVTTTFGAAVEEMKLIGEKHEVEWNDKMNVVRSAWWMKFMKKMEYGEEEDEEKGEMEFPFEEVVEFPPWLMSSKEEEEMNLSEYYSCCSDHHDWRDTALPRMDIEDIEGMDDDWLS